MIAFLKVNLLNTYKIAEFKISETLAVITISGTPLNKYKSITIKSAPPIMLRVFDLYANQQVNNRIKLTSDINDIILYAFI